MKARDALSSSILLTELSGEMSVGSGVEAVGLLVVDADSQAGTAVSAVVLTLGEGLAADEAADDGNGLEAPVLPAGEDGRHDLSVAEPTAVLAHNFHRVLLDNSLDEFRVGVSGLGSFSLVLDNFRDRHRKKI